MISKVFFPKVLKPNPSGTVDANFKLLAMAQSTPPSGTAETGPIQGYLFPIVPSLGPWEEKTS